MNNKETLQSYNERLENNNTNLDSIMEKINNLPEAGGGGSEVIPEQGWYISKTNADGTAKEITVTGYESLPHVRLQGALFESVKKVVVDENITLGKDELFRYSEYIEEIEFKSPTGFSCGASSSYNDGSANRYVFGDCPKLKTIKGQLSIGPCYAFANCTSLTNVEFKPSFTVLKPYMFQNCKSLAWDKIPEQFTQISAINSSNSSSRGHVFDGCESLAISEIPETLKFPWVSGEDTNVRISQYVFNGCKNITISKLPTSWSRIGKYMFAECEKVTISDFTHAKAFGEYALRNCTGITEIITGDNLALIESSAFYGCSNLRKAVIKGTTALTSLPTSLFYNCTSLEELELGEYIATLGATCFAYNTSLKKLTLPHIVYCTNNGIFRNSGIIQLCLPNCKSFGVTSSSASATTFYQTQIKAVWLGSNITTINRYAFRDNTTLKRVFIDKTRAQVAAMTNYNYLFSNNTISADVIVCNDEPGFMNQEQFEAIDWETYEV